MIVFFRRPLIHKLLCIELTTCILRLFQCRNHLFRAHSTFQTKIHRSIRFRIEQIVTLILSIIYAECISYILSGRMHLQTQIATTHGIEKIETYGEILSEPGFDRSTQQLTCLTEHQIIGRHLINHTVDIKIQTIFFRHTIKTPSEIRHILIQVTHLFHPLTAPWRRIKERHYTKRFGCRKLHSLIECNPVYHLRIIFYGSVQPIIHLVHHTFLLIITDKPIKEIPSLIMC